MCASETEYKGDFLITISLTHIYTLTFCLLLSLSLSLSLVVNTHTCRTHNCFQTVHVEVLLGREIADTLLWRRAELVYMRCVTHKTAHPMNVYLYVRAFVCAY